MPSRLADAQIAAQQRLRALVTRGVTGRWQSLAGYDEGDVDAFITAVVPFVAAANRQSVTLTDAYVARALGRQPLGVNVQDVLNSLRGDTTPDQLYRRPFVTVWTALSKATPYDQAVAAGLARATDIAAADVQMAQRAALQAVQDADPRIRGYQRAPDGGACSYCLMIAGAFVKDAAAMPLHPHCGCTLEPVEDDVAASSVPDGVAVHDHGELGPVLADPAHSFDSL